MHFLIAEHSDWLHLTVTHDGTNKILFYINGELDNEVKLPTTKACEACTLTVGFSGSCCMGAGTLDELAICNRALSPNEIKKLMDADSEPFFAVEPGDKLTTTWSEVKN